MQRFYKININKITKFIRSKRNFLWTADKKFKFDNLRFHNDIPWISKFSNSRKLLKLYAWWDGKIQTLQNFYNFTSWRIKNIWTSSTGWRSPWQHPTLRQRGEASRRTSRAQRTRTNGASRTGWKFLSNPGSFGFR